jgi:hypothetical protein
MLIIGMLQVVGCEKREEKPLTEKEKKEKEKKQQEKEIVSLTLQFAELLSVL